MNYYQHHIGDFNNATRHLTRVERSLYRDLIELYYDTETFLTDDVVWLERKMMARTEEEKEALLMVLHEFFTLDHDGYHNNRCDIDIRKYHSNSKAKSKAGKASAVKRKQNSTKRKQKPTPVKQMNNKCATNQEPRTKNHKPKDQEILSCKQDAINIINYLNEKSGKNFKPVDANIKFIIARLNEEHTIENIKAVIDLKCGEWMNDPDMKKYLRPATLFNATKFNQYVGELGSKEPITDEYAHYRKIGKDFKINPTATESDKDYIARVKEKIADA